MTLLIPEPWLSYFTDLQGSQTGISTRTMRYKLSYFTDLQGSQTPTTTGMSEVLA